MQARTLGQYLEVSALGLGCMAMSANAGPPGDPIEMTALIAAITIHGERYAAWMQQTIDR